MSHKVVDTPTILSLCHKRPSKLSNGYKLAWQSFYKLIRDPDSSKNLPHQPRRPRGSRVDHDGWGGGCPSAGGINGSHKACAWASS